MLKFRSAKISSNCRKLSGYRRYQRTHRTIISASKCRRLNSVGRSRLMQEEAYQIARTRLATLPSRSRDLPAARVFFRGALKRHGQPRSITAQHYPRWLRAQPCSTATHGHEERVQLPRSQSCEDTILQVLEQPRGTRPSSRQIPRLCNAGLQVVPKRSGCTVRN